MMYILLSPRGAKGVASRAWRGKERVRRVRWRRREWEEEEN